MKNFTLHNPTKIIFGKGQIATLSNELSKDKKILLTYGLGSIKKNGVYDQIIKALNGYTIFEFGGIEPNPKLEQLVDAIPIIKKHNIDFLLAAGGGSVIDGTKFIAAAAYFEGDPWEIMTNDPSPIKSALPIGCVLTLPAAGSEMNCGMVISKKAYPDKLGSGHDLLYPKFSILDPTVTYDLPPKQIANGIVDTFVHVIEQYLTYPADAAIQDRFAEGILLTLIDIAPKVFADLHNYNFRANLMWSATCALNDLIGVGVPNDWATHRLGHEITARFGLDHAESLAIVLPSLLNVKREQKRGKLLQYSERVWNIKYGTDDEKIDKAIFHTKDFFQTIGVKTRFRDYGINADAVPDLLKQLEIHGLTSLGEHGDIDLKQSEQIYLGCL